MKQIDGSITAVPGIKAAGVPAGIKIKDKKEVALIVAEKPVAAAGVFTINRSKAAPIYVCQGHLKDGIAQAIVVNSGNANACTGEGGMADAYKMAKITADELDIDEKLVLVASTGVIGKRLPMDKIEAAIKLAAKSLSSDGGHDVALAIMTTDLVPKEIAVEIEVAGHPVKIGGITKGSGMIRPHMATMLAFLTTDVNITPELLQTALRDSVDKSFNMMTVDGDMSTNDTALILATGAANNPKITSMNSAYHQFCAGLDYVTLELAKMIARDGEGATKLVKVVVKGAKNFEDAKKAARAVAESNLVKTAIFGMDANWGRIVCALGYSGAEFELNNVDVWMNDLQLVKSGMSAGFSEEKAKEIFKLDELSIISNLHAGDTEATIWTCDFSYDYVRINAAYRT
ncbi:bifunctional glutamate N-acetyltransferase/amino-acid acetyltransferase ArgJ [Candidatus Poribacteria bacterium]|nr:bifunctional glutamate N-acetyltransferase/amino-acid acetyltransferase ArgJ [Candidatus Poribacteria bacterium]